MPLLLLVAGLSAATVGYGGFSRPYAMVLAVLVSLAAGVAVVRGLRRDLAVVPIELRVAAVSLLVLGGWALTRGSLTDDLWSGLPMAGLCLGCAVVLVLVNVAAPSERALLVFSVLVLGAGISLVGWFGSLTHTYPLAMADQGIWRASGPLGYPNALAGLVGPLALVAAGRTAGHPGRAAAVMPALLLTLLLAGWVSAFSRGGAVAMAVGVTLLLLTTPRGSLIRAAWAPVLAALVIVAGLAPSLREGSAPAVAPAVVALVLGLGIAVAPGLLRRRDRSWGLAASAGGAVAAALAVAALAWTAWRYGRVAVDAVVALVSGKVSINTSYRLDQHEAALDEVAGHPLTGVGPGMADLRWTEADGSQLVARYVHDEYVQVLVDTGLVGGVLLGAVLVAVAVTLARGLRSSPSGAAAGIVAGVSAFAVHSGLDFLWHLPVLPLVMMCLVGTVSRRRRVPARQGAGTPETTPADASVSAAAPGRTPERSRHPTG